MKYSQFNSVMPYENKFALYNSSQQKVIFLEDTLTDILRAAVAEGIDNLQDIHPTFYNYLAEQKFLIDDNVDEIEELKKYSKSVDEDESIFLLTINPTMNCNFKCWYCYETHVKNSKLDIDVIDRVKLFIHKTASSEKLKYFSLSFFGGEPLLYFTRDVVPIIDVFTKVCRDKEVDNGISFTTNGYLVNDTLVQYFKTNNLSPTFQITLDGYKDKHDQVRYVSASKGSYEQILRNIRLLIYNEFYVRLRINYTGKNIDDVHKISDDLAILPQELKERYLMIDFHRVWQDDKLDDVYSQVEKNTKILREAGFNVSGKYSPNNVKESCYADKRNSAVINYNGDIFKCTARDFTTVKRAGVLDNNGDLVWENGYLDKRMEAKFHNRPCLTCRITPLCNGGCSQHALENTGQDYCVHYGDESEKDKVIKTKIDQIVNAFQSE